MRIALYAAALAASAVSLAQAQMLDEMPRKRFETAAITPPSAIAPVARDGEIIQSEGGGAIPALPLSVMEANGIRYVTGGIGEEEEAQLKSLERNFNLQVLMTGPEGEYLSRAMVRVLDEQNNEVLRVENAGPYFYTDLRPGRYRVEVTAPQGGIRKTDVIVPSSGIVKRQLRFSVA